MTTRRLVRLGLMLDRARSGDTGPLGDELIRLMESAESTVLVDGPSRLADIVGELCLVVSWLVESGVLAADGPEADGPAPEEGGAP